MNAEIDEPGWNSWFYNPSWETEEQREQVENALKEKRDVSYQ